MKLTKRFAMLLAIALGGFLLLIRQNLRGIRNSIRKKKSEK